VLLVVASIAVLVVSGCRPAKAPVEEPEPRVSDWDSGLSIEMEFDVAESSDSVAVTAFATATNVTKSTRDLCVNLHFVAGFQEASDTREQPESPPIEPTNWSGAEVVHEIASSPWKKNGKASCTPRSLEPGEGFQERFDFNYSKAGFANVKGSVYVMCEVWFQTRMDIPNQSLTCDMGRFGFEKVPAR